MLVWACAKATMLVWACAKATRFWSSREQRVVYAVDMDVVGTVVVGGE